MDLGASPGQAMRRVLPPLLSPAILASFAMVFALSIDDFVITIAAIVFAAFAFRTWKKRSGGDESTIESIASFEM